MHSLALSCALTRIRMRSSALTSTRIHACAITRTHMHSLALTYALMRIHSHSHAHTHIYIYMYMYISVYIYIYIYIYIYTDTYICTCIYPLPIWCRLVLNTKLLLNCTFCLRNMSIISVDTPLPSRKTNTWKIHTNNKSDWCSNSV